MIDEPMIFEIFELMQTLSLNTTIFLFGK